TAVFGTYTVTEEAGIPYLNLIIDQGTSKTYNKSFEIVYSDYSEVRIKHEYNGDVGIITLQPKASGAYIEPF
ncbi:MAG: hypothetical protein KDC92_11865, partial [Bacteroidetes bacterium]|nr:hypothetical protein [Bacteroidota bacterium]